MSIEAHHLAIGAFTLIMAAAAFEDFRRLIIPNLFTGALCLLWPVYFAANPSLAGGLAAVGCALAVFIVGALLFARGYVGGGDVKLLSAAALWAGPAGTPSLLLITGVLGGALALLLIMPLGAAVIDMARLRIGGTAAAPSGGPAVPYGVAIAAAALVVILSPVL